MKRRKFWKKVVVAAVCLLMATIVILILQAREQAKYWYPVVRVVDGDTIVVNFNGINETVRLIGADAPETVDPKTPIQCFGPQATEEAKKSLLSQKIYIVSDPTQGDRDQYGRLLRYVFLADGTNLEEFLIRNGYAREETFKGVAYRFQAEFKEAERVAKAAGVGMWGDGICK